MTLDWESISEPSEAILTAARESCPPWTLKRTSRCQRQTTKSQCRPVEITGSHRCCSMVQSIITRLKGAFRNYMYLENESIAPNLLNKLRFQLYTFYVASSSQVNLTQNLFYENTTLVFTQHIHISLHSKCFVLEQHKCFPCVFGYCFRQNQARSSRVPLCKIELQQKKIIRI